MANEERNFMTRFETLFTGWNNGFSFEDKKQNISYYILYLLNRTQVMFKWDGLPETIPERSLELYLQMNGHCAFYKYDDKLYIFTGGLGGKPDVYYMPTLYVIANPALNISKNLVIDKDCVVMRNDDLYLGLLPLFSKYASMLAENELSMNVALINSRIMSLITADDDNALEAAKKYFEDIKNGKLGAIGKRPFLDGITVQPYGATSQTNVLTNLIEFEQYCKASLYNDIGLNANYNMKRESLNSAESQMNNDALLPLVDDMLKCRKECAEKVNNMFGTSISVDFASAWEDNIQEIDLEHEALENDNSTQMENIENGRVDDNGTVND